MLEFRAEVDTCIYAFEGQVSAQFNNIEAHDLGEIIEKVSILQADIFSLTESNIPTNPLVLSSVVQPAPPHGPRCFDFFTKDDQTILYLGPRDTESWIIRILMYHMIRP